MKYRKQILRVIDVNFNRSKEGLRVVEDVFRFILENETLRKRTRRLRHALNNACRSRIIKTAITYRDARGDLGKATDDFEMKRTTISDILFGNMQRVKESTRVLEEFFKLIEPKQTPHIKSIRYRLYTLEQDIIAQYGDRSRMCCKKQK